MWNSFHDDHPYLRAVFRRTCCTLATLFVSWARASPLGAVNSFRAVVCASLSLSPVAHHVYEGIPQMRITPPSATRSSSYAASWLSDLCASKDIFRASGPSLWTTWRVGDENEKEDCSVMSIGSFAQGVAEVSLRWHICCFVGQGVFQLRTMGPLCSAVFCSLSLARRSVCEGGP